MKKRFQVGIVAPSSKVPEVEFELGLERLREAGFDPQVSPQVLSSHLFFAGTDEERARAIYDFGWNPNISAIWAARGGYGSVRVLPWLERLTARNGRPPKKLFAGFSDSTALMEFVRTRWGWETLHCPMPGLRKFCELPEAEWKPLVRLIRGEKVRAPFGNPKLEFLGARPGRSIRGPLVGGNLCVWTSLVGTPYAGQVKGKIVFFEDCDENLYRIDRMVQQLLWSDSLKGARAIVLGNFLNCRDIVPQVIAQMPVAREKARTVRSPKADELVPLRPVLDPQSALDAIFAEVGRKYRIPVARGLPVGHGPAKAPLPLGVIYELTPQGRLRLQD